jgi:hypothetical protein
VGIEEYVAHFAMQVAEATKSSAANGVTEVLTHEYVTRFFLLAAAATNTLIELHTHEYVTRFVMLAAAATNTLNLMNVEHKLR